MAKEYVFIDEWEVDAPQEAVFNALVDARTYPERNHNWSIQRAIEGLEPYARSHGARAAGAA